MGGFSDAAEQKAAVASSTAVSYSVTFTVIVSDTTWA